MTNTDRSKIDLVDYDGDTFTVEVYELRDERGTSYEAYGVYVYSAGTKTHLTYPAQGWPVTGSGRFIVQAKDASSGFDHVESLMRAGKLTVRR